MLQNKIHKIIFTLGIFFILINAVHAQERLTLKDAIETALKNNYDILVAKGDAEISDNNYSLGNAGFLPRLDLSGAASRTITKTHQEYSTGQIVDKDNSGSKSQSASATLTWTIFDGLRMFVSYARLKEYKELGEVKLRAQVETSVADIIKTYYDIVRQKYNYKVALEGVSISEQRVKLTEERFSVGSASKLDVLRAKVDLNADKSNLLTQESTLNSLKVTLNTLLGRAISTEYDVEEEIDITKGLLFDQLKESAFRTNVDILQSEKNKNISEGDIGVYRADFMPRINLTTGYSYSNSVSDAGFFKTNENYGYNYGINLSWNLFNGFNSALQYQNAIISLDKNEIKLRQSKAVVEAALIVSYQNYEKNLELLNLEEENVSVAKENVDLALEQLRIGSLSPIEFRDVQKNYINAQSRLSTALFNAKISERDLLKQSGLLMK